MPIQVIRLNSAYLFFCLRKGVDKVFNCKYSSIQLKSAIFRLEVLFHLLLFLQENHKENVNQGSATGLNYTESHDTNFVSAIWLVLAKNQQQA